MSETVFQKIIKEDIPSVKIYEDDICIVILDRFPNVEGQSLIIPKTPVDYAFDLNDETYTHILKVAKRVVQATDKALNPFRTCLIIEGFEVPHAHIKLFPVREAKLSTASGPEASDEDLETIANKIRAELA